MRIAAIIFGVVAALALAGLVAKATHQKAGVCGTESCPTSECP